MLNTCSTVAPASPGVLDTCMTRCRLAADPTRVRLRVQKYLDPTGGAFQLRTDERPMKLPELMEAARREFEEQHRYRPVQSRPAPPPPEAEVRLNAAAILREDAVYRKKQEEEAAALLAYEQELRDTSEFERWRAEMLAKDERERMEEVERRRKEMAMAQENAIEAR